MNEGIEMEKISENVEIFLTLVEKSRKEKSITDHVINLKMVYTPETSDCEIFIDQVGGRLSSISEVKNIDPATMRERRKPKMKKWQAKNIEKGTEHFMGRIHEATNRQRKIERIILEHNFKSGVTDLYVAFYR